MTGLIGHDKNRARFLAAMAGGKLHHGWIFAGTRGLGKAGFAMEMAARVVDPDSNYRSMIDHGSHPDIIILNRLPKEMPKEGENIAPDAELRRNISIEQIRDLQRKLTTRPGLSQKRVVIIDAADDLERGGANALLKSLEEPPAGTYFFLISHASDRLLPTIRSRCQLLRFDPLGRTEMANAIRMALENAGQEIPDDELDALIMAGKGSPGQALAFAGLALSEIEYAIRDIIREGDRDNRIRNKLASTLSLKSAQPRYEAFLQRVPQIIAEEARRAKIADTPPILDAWAKANEVAARAIALSLDRPSVIFQMGSLLAGLQAHR